MYELYHRNGLKAVGTLAALVFGFTEVIATLLFFSRRVVVYLIGVDFYISGFFLHQNVRRCFLFQKGVIVPFVLLAVVHNVSRLLLLR